MLGVEGPESNGRDGTDHRLIRVLSGGDEPRDFLCVVQNTALALHFDPTRTILHSDIGGQRAALPLYSYL
jgi:hypothetical protein